MSGEPAAKRAAVAERRVKAINLRLAGVDWQTIADKLGYTSRGAACQDVTRAFEQRRKAEGRAAEEMRHVETERLDRLQAAVWGRALKGDLKAVETVLRIMARRALLNGLDAPTKADTSVKITYDIPGVDLDQL